MRYTLIICCLSFLNSLNGQIDSVAVDAPATIHLLAKYTDEGTVLRWGYGESETWYRNFREGVVLERRRVSPDPTEFQPIDIVKLLPAEELLDIAAAEQDELVSVVHSVSYEEWENSLFDGNSDDIADKQDNFNNRYALYHLAADRSQLAARVAGLGYVDTDIAPDVTYAYRVISQGTPKVLAIKVVAPVNREVRPLIADVKEEENAVVLRWDRALHNRYFSGYHIERRSEQSEGWERLTKVPYVMGYDPEHFDPAALRYFTYRDSVANDISYLYRLVGLDAFGDISAPSPPVVGHGRDRTPPPMPQLSVDLEERSHLTKTLSWEQPEGEAVVSYHLQRKFRGKESLVIDFARPGDRVKIDSVDEAGTYIYRLIAQDAAGNLAWSPEVWTTVYDLNPPRQPSGLKAEVDTSGLVVLTWDEPGNDDVFGYHVYAADGERRAFERITNRPHRWRRFVDTVSTNLLNQYRDYYVVATDKDFLYSEKSEVLRVRRPDKIPPAPAHVSDFKVQGNGIWLALRPSHSKDASTHRLLRREQGSEVSTIIGEWRHPTYPPFNQVDTTAELGKTYLYAYQAEDDGGLKSAIISEVQVSMRPRQLDAPALSGAWTNDQLVLTWNQQVGAAGWQLYRSIDGGPETRLPTLSASKNEYLDGRVKPGQKATYRLRLIRQDGRRSPFSQPFEISL